MPKNDVLSFETVTGRRYFLVMEISEPNEGWPTEDQIASVLEHSTAREALMEGLNCGVKLRLAVRGDFE